MVRGCVSEVYSIGSGRGGACGFNKGTLYVRRFVIRSLKLLAKS